MGTITAVDVLHGRIPRITARNTRTSRISPLPMPAPEDREIVWQRIEAQAAASRQAGESVDSVIFAQAWLTGRSTDLANLLSDLGRSRQWDLRSQRLWGAHARFRSRLRARLLANPGSDRDEEALQLFHEEPEIHKDWLAVGNQ